MLTPSPASPPLEGKVLPMCPVRSVTYARAAHPLLSEGFSQREVRKHNSTVAQTALDHRFIASERVEVGRQPGVECVPVADRQPPRVSVPKARGPPTSLKCFAPTAAFRFVGEVTARKHEAMSGMDNCPSPQHPPVYDGASRKWW